MNIFEVTEKLLETYEEKFIRASRNYPIVHEYWDVASEFFEKMRQLYPRLSTGSVKK